VEAFDSGGAALEKLHIIEPDLILADVVMPEPTGYELCKQVKALGAGIPVVLMSSAFEPYDAELAAACGADQHLVKPFDSGTLVETVRKLLGPAIPDVAEGDEREAELSQVDDAIEALLDVDETDQPLEFNDDPVSELDERLVEAVSKAVVQRLSEQVVREIAREVVPDLAERIIRERIRQLESEDS